ncbi:putative inactive ubiquitin-specific-processing protease 10 [Hyphodiscus hymeniophilus]|uniref:Inactive ubiquitin-specific-processing protease 10 n=1 Tax=Hyphodiscus hymeniophilus TaxID=353542 RepID=A0A9P6SKI5_9HELO|nr:putative inactive ubiquitin-specific-processing protease 10 [Hyphodiscus hymeniophilus]
MEGLLVLDFQDRFPAAYQELCQWLVEGKLQPKETIIKGGLAAAEQALVDLFKGINTGNAQVAEARRIKSAASLVAKICLSRDLEKTVTYPSTTTSNLYLTPNNMAKRQAAEALEDVAGTDSPASKKSRVDNFHELHNGSELPARTKVEEIVPAAEHNGEHGIKEEEEEAEEDDIIPVTRQAAPVEGFDDLYLDTIDRKVLDFDFEKLCSVSLSNINVYACLVCGKYYQGRGPKSHAYFHALEVGHHVYINMQTQKVYVLPEGYEVKNKSLEDIKFVSDPTYTKQQVMAMDREAKTAWALGGKEYVPGFVGMNNIKDNDYFNVVVQALSHVPPLRNYFMLESFGTKPELAKRLSILVRKIWNPRAFKSHVSPHELLQEISLKSNKKFTLTTQSDPADFLSWFLNNMHLALGELKVESQEITAKADAGDRLRFEEAAEVKTDVNRFMMLTLDLPTAPLFQDELQQNIIPQVPLTNILSKYDGLKAQEHLNSRRRYRLVHPLPPYLLFHVKRFSKNKFVSERNPTIVTFDARNLDMAPYVEPSPNHHRPGDPIWYDLVANIVHEAVRGREDSVEGGEEKKVWKVQVRDRAREEWIQVQDLYVEKTQKELLYLGESYLQIWERRRDGKGKER